jgi:hypothetical protein
VGHTSICGCELSSHHGAPQLSTTEPKCAHSREQDSSGRQRSFAVSTTEHHRDSLGLCSPVVMSCAAIRCQPPVRPDESGTAPYHWARAQRNKSKWIDCGKLSKSTETHRSALSEVTHSQSLQDQKPPIHRFRVQLLKDS